MRQFNVCGKITDKYVQTASKEFQNIVSHLWLLIAQPRKHAKIKTYPDSKNLSWHASVLSESSGNPTLPWSQAPSPDGDESDLEEVDTDLVLLIHFDSLKTNFEQEEAS